LHEIRNPLITLPVIGAHNEPVWHVFVVRAAARDEFQSCLRERGIDTLIHYPQPPHQQHAYAEWNARSYPITERIHREILSLPISPVMNNAQIDSVIAACNDWRG
jgi:dTDP-4-amino-4,6-dideoxygalactose transaminase